MVKAEREVDFEYGLFVEERLSEYTPHSEREIVHFEYPEEEQKIVNDDPRQRLIQYPPMPLDVYESLPEIAKPLFRHAVRM
mgnify:CR=1 FL=1